MNPETRKMPQVKPTARTERTAVNKRKRISISAEKAEYLARLRASDPTFSELLQQNPNIEIIVETSVLLSRVDSETLRDFFTVKLATVGFDEHYALNPEGRMLEDLIDRFFMPEEE